MRVVWVLPHAGVADGSRLAAWVIPWLSKAGHAVEVLPLEAYDGALQPFSVPLLEPPIGRSLGRRLQMTGVLRRCLTRYDRVVVDQNLEIELAAAVARGAQRGSAMVIGVAHIPLTHLLAARGEHEVGRLRLQIARRYPRLDRWVAISRGVGEDLVVSHRVNASRVVVVPPPLPAELLEAASREGAPANWPYPDDGVPTVATVGHLDHLKGVAVLLQALKLLEERGRHARLLVVGDGPERASLEQLARSLGLTAHFAGWVPDQELGRWLGACTVYVAPQYFDGAGLDLWMALASGLPAIATDGPVAPGEVVGKGRFGRMVTLGEPLALLEELERLLDDASARDALALAGRQRARGVSGARVQEEWVRALGLGAS